jgi:nanoRNase/pAp phosphatase (c-di-AMP/oligoRNAs hydrolase)
MDPRTGLGRFRNFTISNYDLMTNLAKACAEKSIYDILVMPDVKERLDFYYQQEKPFIEMIKEHTRAVGSVLVVDLRNVDTIYAGNRFYIYTLFPEQNISMWVVDGRNKANVAITIGHSIINRTATLDVGSILLHYGGGGHRQVGTCQVSNEQADTVVNEILEKINKV